LIHNPIFEKVWKTINNLKIKKDEIALSMAANFQINCEEQKNVHKKDPRLF